MSDTKVCSKCKAEKPRPEFFKKARNPDGLRYECKACETATQRARYQNANGREKSNERYRAIVSTPEGAATYAWHRLNGRVKYSGERHTLKTYRGVEVRMAREEFMAWAVPAYTAWMADHPGEAPSLDRIRETGHYELGNLQVLPRSENSGKTRRAINRTAAPEGTKHCGRCKQFLPFDQFKKTADGKGTFGLFGWCIPCVRENDRERQKRRRKRGAVDV